MEENLLKYKIFKNVCLGTTVVTGLAALGSSALELPITWVLAIITLINIGVFISLKRNPKNLKFLVPVFIINCLVAFGLGSTTNGGIHGTFPIVFVALAVIYTGISGSYAKWVYTGLTILTAVIVSLVQLNTPDSFIAYTSIYQEIADKILATTGGTVLTVYVMGTYVKHHRLEHKRQLELKNELKNEKEALKIKSEELEKVNQQLEDFTSIVTHDLKTPLRGIHHYVEFFEEDFKKDIPLEGQEMLTGIKKLSSKMDRLINDVLTFSKADKAEINYKKFNLSDPLNVVIADIQNQPDIEIAIEFNNLPNVKGDLIGLKESFLNFITNAFKYNNSPEKKITFNYNPISKELTISDNGIGIAKEDLGKVFAFFKRVHGKEEYGGGTGAGMAIVKRILERQGITISIESELGTGTSFTLNLTSIVE